MTLVNANTASSHFIAPNVTADTLLTFQLTITDNGGASSVSSVNITVQNINLPPIANSGGDQVVNSADAIYLDGSASYDPDGIILSYNWIQTAGPTVVLATADTKEAGFVAPMVDVATVINFQLTVVDDAGNSAAANVAVTVNSILATLPPDPATIAPPLDPNVPSNIYDMTSFLYTGANPIQTGVAAGTIEARRAVVLRGKVLDRQNIPLPGVNITVRRHSEFGQTISRVDGMFDLVINGGSYTTVNYKKDGFISIQREINTPWDQFALLPNVVMLPLDTQATVIDLTSTIPIQVAQGSIETDADGTRRAVILFPAGVNASLLMPDGTKQPISKLTVRATEYTVGSNGPEAMPGDLPPTSAYTYAAELSVDEAIAARATSVEFDTAIPFYIDNFLNIPTGIMVPTGSYDRGNADWVASNNGRVIEVLAINAGMAELDVDGSGLAANVATLTSMGITDAERAKLASLYTVGASMWRSTITHFTPWDLNFPSGLPQDFIFPPPYPPLVNYDASADEPDECSGCIIEAQTQVLGEQINVVGTPYSLNYRSNRTKGYIGGNKYYLRIAPSSIPPSLKEIAVSVKVGGTLTHRTFSPTPNLSTEFFCQMLLSMGNHL